jgi:hypothetical protein
MTAAATRTRSSTNTAAVCLALNRSERRASVGDDHRNRMTRYHHRRHYQVVQECYQKCTESVVVNRMILLFIL